MNELNSTHIKSVMHRFMFHAVLRCVVMQSIHIRFPPDEIDRVDELVEQSKYFENRSSFVRFAVREALQKEANE